MVTFLITCISTYFSKKNTSRKISHLQHQKKHTHIKQRLQVENKEIAEPRHKVKSCSSCIYITWRRKTVEGAFGVLQVANLELGDCFSKFFYRYLLHHFSIKFTVLWFSVSPNLCFSQVEFLHIPRSGRVPCSHTSALRSPRKSMTCMFKCHPPTVSTTNLHIFRQHTSETS